jgi:hypothetical protein
MYERIGLFEKDSFLRRDAQYTKTKPSAKPRPGPGASRFWGPLPTQPLFSPNFEDPQSDFKPNTADSVPGTETVVSRIKALRNEYLAEDGYKCLDCNERGCAYLSNERNPQEAYIQLKMGVLGTGESEHSKLVTQYFNECLDRFCGQEKIEDSVNELDSIIGQIREVVIVPEYDHLRTALSAVICESRKAGRLSEAIRFQREAIFFTILEGTESDFLGEEGHVEYCEPLERRISNGIQELHSLMKTCHESNDK